MAAALALGTKVTFKKYGAEQKGVISGIRKSETVETTETTDDAGADPVVKSRGGVSYRVDYTLKNGTETREWMRAASFEEEKF